MEAVAGDYVLLHDYLDADKWFTKSAEWNPNNFQVLYYLARTKYKENRFDEAAAVFTQCLKLDPKSVKAGRQPRFVISRARTQSRGHECIPESDILGGRRTTGRRFGPYIDLGSLLVDTDRASEALPYLVEAVKMSPNEMRARRELGKAYMHLDELEKAQSELEKSAQLAPENAPIHFMLPGSSIVNAASLIKQKWRPSVMRRSPPLIHPTTSTK